MPDFCLAFSRLFGDCLITLAYLSCRVHEIFLGLSVLNEVEILSIVFNPRVHTLLSDKTGRSSVAISIWLHLTFLANGPRDTLMNYVKLDSNFV